MSGVLRFDIWVIGGCRLYFPCYLRFPLCVLLGRGGGGGYGGDGVQMETQYDTVFVQGLPEDVTESDLAAHFGSIGVIKVTIVLLILKFQSDIDTVFILFNT